MSFFHKVWKLFLYAGVEKEEYKNLLPNIHKENRLLLKVFSRIAAAMFFVLLIVSALSTGFANVNSNSYLLSGLEMLTILFCTRFFLPKYPALVMVLVYFFEISLYVFGIQISLLHVDKAAVSAVAFLLVSPLLFYDRPLRLSALITIVVTAFCVIVKRVKKPDVAESDIWNMITFGIVAIAATVFIMSIKVRALKQSSQIEYMSQTDLLTGVKNRNHYENRLLHYPKQCKNNLICVYADVNGLHEMNNEKGHLAGDKMLRESAEVMRNGFGLEHTYRVGGDEFVSFRPDGNVDDVNAAVDKMRQSLADMGYNVAFGVAACEMKNGTPDMFELIKEAEMNMFAEKQEFYRQGENDRSHRYFSHAEE